MKTALAYLFVLYVLGLLLFVFGASHWQLVEEPSVDDIRELPPTVEFKQPLPDFASITNIKERKAAFFGYFRPLIHLENGLILDQRKKLLSISEKLTKGETPSAKEKLLVDKLAEYYEVEEETLDAKIQDLIKRVNIVPVSMALAQAATESAWGTSRFAQRAKNFFGQWCYKTGCGLIPRNRPVGAKHEVAKFKTAQASVRSYFRNINSHPAYKELRNMRHKLEMAGKPITGTELVGGLGKYSQRGDAYIEELRSIIRFNKLEQSSQASMN